MSIIPIFFEADSTRHSPANNSSPLALPRSVLVWIATATLALAHPVAAQIGGQG
jgi:hypothetical protein